ncbi:hypothetical protein HBI68_256000 [Parastagonospora nodorum]|nr:hypothetical protein HBI68_256000 [Parastagonospora nodorum]
MQVDSRTVRTPHPALLSIPSILYVVRKAGAYRLRQPAIVTARKRCIVLATVPQYTIIWPGNGYFLFSPSTNATTASSSSSTSYSTTRYRMFFRVVCPRSHTISSFFGSPITSKNTCSSLGCSVAVKYTICVSARSSRLSPSIRLRKPPSESSTTWHSSTTIRSSRPIARCRLM